MTITHRPIHSRPAFDVVGSIFGRPVTVASFITRELAEQWCQSEDAAPFAPTTIHEARS